MGLGNFHFSFPVEGVMLVFAMYGMMSMAVLKKTAQSILHWAGFGSWSLVEPGRRRFSVARYETLLRNRRWAQTVWGGAAITAGEDHCSVCLCGFEDSEEIGELSCKHFFHKDCLQRWVDHRRWESSCPLCRSVM